MELIRKYFPGLDHQKKSRYSQLFDLYRYWNEKINVISRKDIDHLYERHILHSLSIAKSFHFKNGTNFLDVGTGGGFPGIPLAIFYPNCTFTLIDSISKKMKVVDSIIEHLQLNNTRTITSRIENFEEKYNFIVARAVTNLPVFMNWVSKNIDDQRINNMENGVIYLKGGDLSNEIRPYKNARIIPISDFFSEKFFRTKKIVYIPL